MLSSNGNTWRRDFSHIYRFVRDLFCAYVNVHLCIKVSVYICVCYLLRGYQPEQSPVEVDLFLQLLRGKERAFTWGTSRLQRRKGYVEDGALYVCVILDVEHKHCFPFSGQHSCHTLKEEAKQRREESLLGHVLQPHSDAVGQHVISDDGDTQCADGHNSMDTIWKKERENIRMSYTFNYLQLKTAVKGKKATG